MTNAERLKIEKDRLTRLENSPKNLKCPGVIRKQRRKVRNLEKCIA